MMHYWTEEEKEFLRQHYPSYSRRELLGLFNKHFNLNISMIQLASALTRYGIKSGRTGRFEKGQEAWNKGMKGLSFGGTETQFKKGQKPFNYKPVGTERVDENGYTLIKVSDKGEWHERWRHKHKVIWEKAHGPIPEGHVILFADGNKQNLDINNLILVSKGQLSMLNRHRLIQNDADLTKVGITIVDIYKKIGERKRANL